MEPLICIILFCTAFFVSFVGTNVGGTGLFAVHVLMLLGLPPHAAVATRRVLSLGSVPVGLWVFLRNGKVFPTAGIIVAVFTFIGSYIGANLLLEIPEDLVRKLIALFTLSLLVFVLLKPEFGVKPKKTSFAKKVLGSILYMGVGFNGAFFGGGSQIFASMILISCYGLSFLESAGTRKIAGIVSAITSFSVYLTAGIINWPYGLVMLGGGITGSYLGSVYGIKMGNAWVRKLFMFMMVVLSLRLLFGA